MFLVLFMTGKLKSLLVFLICFLALTTAKGAFAVYPVAKKRHLSLSIFIFAIAVSFVIFTPTKAYGATEIFRSVGPSATAALAAGTSNALTISGSTATFVSNLPANIGVGDVIQYDSDGNSSIDAIAFIHGRTSAKVYTVYKADGLTNPTAVAGDNDWSIFRAYTSLANAESGIENTSINSSVANFDDWTAGGDATTDDAGKNLVTADQQWNIACYANGTTADIVKTTINDWTTGATQYIRIFTPTSQNQVGVTQRHTGVWDTSKYHLLATSPTHMDYAIRTYAYYTRIDGLQIKTNPTASWNRMTGFNITFGSGAIPGEMQVSNSIFTQDQSTSNTSMIAISTSRGAVNYKIYNNLFYDMLGSGENISVIDIGNSSPAEGLSYIYNNTFANITNNGFGVKITVPDKDIMRNNLFYNVTTPAQGTFAIGTDYNATSNASMNYTVTGSGNTHDRLSQTFAFVNSGSKNFHLASNDGAAIDKGINLSADANLPFATDIDGQARPIGASWDIGADEAEPKKVFYSVGQSTADLKTGTPNVSITNGVATFDVAQTGNIGVGDVMVVGGVSYYISSKTSTTIWNVVTVTGGIPADISSTAVTSIKRVYTALQSAVAGAPTLLGTSDLVTGNYQLNFPCYYDSTADTTAVTVGGYTTGVANYIKIYTPNNTVTEANVSQRHGGKWDEGKYRLETIVNYGASITIAEEYFRVDGVQVKFSNNATNSSQGISHAFNNTNSANYISNCIITTGTIIGGTRIVGIGYGSSSSSRNVYIYNNVIYNISGGTNNNGIYYTNDSAYTKNIYAYNNTVYGCEIGFYRSLYSIFVAKNNIAYDNTTDYAGVFDTSSTNNLSKDGTAPGLNPKINQVVNFVDAASKDFHLSPSDTSARDAGTNSIFTDSNLNFQTDIDGTTRGATPDIGADELPREFVSTICQNTSAGGDCANLDYNTLSSWESEVDSDLTAKTTRVYQGSRTGTLASGNSVTLMRSAVSTGITATVVAKTSDQILIRDITGTDGTMNGFVAQVNDVWQKDVSNYWTITGTGDDLGASTQVTAKIDGAWTVADTTKLTIDGWETDIDNYIKIYTAGLARHNGKWSDSDYRISVADTVVINYEHYLRVDGLQIKLTAVDTGSRAAFMHQINEVSDSELYFSNSILRGELSGTTSGSFGFRDLAVGALSSTRFWNNILYGWSNGDLSQYAIVNDKADHKGYFYNNTIFNSRVGIWSKNNDATAINNLFINTTTPFLNTFNAATTHNATNGTTTPTGGSNTITNASVNFISTTPGSEDFHLLETSTDVINTGADLSNDAWIPASAGMTKDIDGSLRSPDGLGFDIGADETATKIYRSVGPGTTAALTNDGSHARNITLASGIATFSVALADNIGVGDAVLIDTGGTNDAIDASDTLLFIHGRTDSTHYTLRTQTGAVPSDIAVNDTYQIYRAYTSLSNAEAGTKNTGIPIAFTGGNRDLVANNEQWNIACYANGTTADTTAVTIDGWVTGTQNYLKVYTPVATNEVGVSQRHSGKWDDAKYKMVLGDGSNQLIYIINWHVEIEGLQIHRTNVSSGYYRGIYANNFIKISSNIVKASSNTSTSHSFGVLVQPSFEDEAYLANNIVYGFDVGINISGSVSSYAYNNTVIGCEIGFGEYASVDPILKNNIAYNNDENYADTYSALSSNNISGPTQTNAPGLNPVNGVTVQFVDELNDDFHLAQSDTAARNAGANLTADTNLPFSTDIDGQLRNPVGAGWDIGADEGSVDFAPTVMETGGDYSSLASWEAGVETDLVADTTRVFSHGGKTGTIGDGASVTGLTSSATATVVHASATQILLENISGIFQSGEVVQVSAGNSVTLSGNGNPANAVAKIDGAWTVDDGSVMTIDGWETGVNNYIKIYTTPVARHNGKWDSSKYRMYIYRAEGQIMPKENYVKIEGLQFSVHSNSSAYTSGISLYHLSGEKIDIEINDCFFKGMAMNVNRNAYIYIRATPKGQIKILNNIFGPMTSSNIDTINGAIVLEGSASALVSVYNNTFYQSVRSIQQYNSAGGIIAKNNIAQSCASNCYSGTFAASSSNNISSDGTAPGTNSKTSTTVQFVDAVNEDFHLSLDDTAARNAGADLSADSNLPFNTDIDGQARLAGVWDIGADETLTEIYRSVGPAKTDALATDSSHANTISLSSGIATFSSALPDNIGVGDAVLIDTGGTDQTIDASDTLLFIHGRTDSTHYALRTQTGAMPTDIGVNDTWKIYRAHVSLSNAESGTINPTLSGLGITFIGGNRDLVANNEQWNLACYADAVDTSRVTVKDWETGGQNYLKIYTPVTLNEVGITQRHSGKWDENGYRIDARFAYSNVMIIETKYLVIDGLQTRNQPSNNAYNISIDVSGFNIVVSNSIINEAINGGLYASYDMPGVLKVYNTIIENVSGNGLAAGYPAHTLYVYNNTFINNGTAIVLANYDTPYKYLINNIFANNAEDTSPGGKVSAGTDYNITNNSSIGYAVSGGGNIHDKVSQSVSFVDAANGDFHLQSNDTAAKDAGMNLNEDIGLPFSSDIDGDARPIGSTWDIGADESAFAESVKLRGDSKIRGNVEFR